MFNKKFIKEVGAFKWVYKTAIRQFYKRILRKDHMMTLANNERFTVFVNSHFAGEAFITDGDVDWGSEKLLYSMLERKGVFLDVGANIGYYSIYMRPKVTEVFCFEPDPRVRVLLTKNIDQKPNMHVMPIAVGAMDGKTVFTLGKSAEVSHLSNTIENDKNQIEVDIVTIDSFVKNRRISVEAIKIDAEGHDIEVIEGAMKTVATQRPIILTEALPEKKLFDLMSAVSYKIFAYVRHSKTRTRSFKELISGSFIDGETKMLFLVPVHLIDTIKNNASL